MDRNRLLTVGSALAAVVVVALGFLFGVQPHLQAAAQAKASIATLRQQSQSLEATVASLQAQHAQLGALKDQFAGLEASVPSTEAGTAFLAEVNSIAVSSGVSITNMTQSEPTAYTPPVSTATTGAASGTSSSTASASPSPSASASATATAAPVPTGPVAPVLASNSAITATNFSVITESISFQGDYSQAMAFVKGLRTGARLVLVNTISASQGTGGTGTASAGLETWTVSGLVYSLTLPASSSTQGAATTTGTSSSTDTAAGK